MDKADALLRASEVARALVVVNNTLMDSTMATYQPERDTVQFYLYNSQGERVEHFRFEATRSEYVIHDVLCDAERYRSGDDGHALSVWASHILGYINAV